MLSQSDFQLTLDFLKSKPVVVVPSADQVSSDAGLLPFRQLDERIGLQLTQAATRFSMPPQTTGCGGEGGLCPRSATSTELSPHNGHASPTNASPAPLMNNPG